MKKLSKALFIFFSIGILGAFLVISAFAEIYTGSCGTNVNYKLDTSTGLLEITGSGYMSNYFVNSSEAPWYLKNSYVKTVKISQGVKNIGSEAFWRCENLTSITIPDSVTSIGGWAFNHCDSLKDITIPNSVTSLGSEAFFSCANLTTVTLSANITSIGYRTFYNCTNLNSITLPDNLKSIGDLSFYGCSSLTSAEIPDNVTSIGERAFQSCSSLTSVTIPDSVTSIGSWAFGDCSSLTSVEIGDSVTSIGDYAFYDCSSLTSVEIGDSVTSIGNYAFKNCNSLTSVEIPDSVTSIGEYAFYNCNSLTSVEIGDSVTSIGTEAFYGCSSLTSVVIPKSVTSIGDSAFSICSSLLSIEVDANNKSYCDVDGVLFTNDKATLIQYPIGNKATNYAILDGVKIIEDCAFSHCNSIKSIVIPRSVACFCSHAFSYCEGLESITIPSGASSKYIYSYAFSNCSNLTSVTIESQAITIYSGAFDNCSSLETIYLYYNSSVDKYFSSSEYTKKYLDVYYIYYNLNGGSGDFARQKKSHGETVYINSDIPTKQFYNFAGWKGSNGGVYSAGEAYSVNSNITLTAIWEPISVNLIYDSCGGDISTLSKSVQYDRPFGELETPIRDVYIFDGWFTEKEGGNTVSSETIVDFTEDKTIFAHWSVISYLIYYDANGGTISDSGKTVTYDCAYGNLPTPILPGFVFDGWYTDISGGELITSETIVKTAKDHTLYARWKGAEYLVIFDANGGECETDSKIVIFGTAFGELPIPTRKGYTFITWSKTKTASGAVNFESVYQSTSDTTLYAVWEVNTYKLIFDALGGKIDIDYKTVTYGSPYGLLPISLYPNYIFGGWFLEKEYANKITSETIVSTAEDHTVYAMWIPLNYTIIYNANGGEGAPEQQTKEYGTDATLSDVEPTRKGFRFKGWSTTADGVVVYAPSAVYSENADLTLYAVWEAINYGDPSGDGEINAVDAVLLAQKIAGWDVELDISAADCNGDGEVNAIDAVLLAQFIAGWDVVLG